MSGPDDRDERRAAVRSLRPLLLRRRWLDARRERRLVVLLRWVAVVTAVALLVGGVVLVRGLSQAPHDDVVEACATGPWALAPITAAGGVGAALADPQVLAPYTTYPALTDISIARLRAAASNAGDHDLSRLVFLAGRARPDAQAQRFHEVEVACAAILDAAGRQPQPADWFADLA